MKDFADSFQQGTSKLDIKLLERLLKETTVANDRTGAYVIYFIPLKEEFTDICQYIMAKHGVKMEKYNSSLNAFPVLKTSFKDIDALTEQAKEFLFAIDVNPNKLEQHMTNIMLEMQSRTKSK